MCGWSGAIGGFIAAQRAAGKSEQTCATRRQHLERVGRAFGGSPWTVEADALIAWLASQQWATETRRSYRASLALFYRWGVATGQALVDIGASLPLVRASKPNPRPVPDRMYHAALATAGAGMRADPARVRLMVRMAAELGMRRGEIAVSHASDILPDLTGWSLIVHGKGGKERVVPMPDDLAGDLRARGTGFIFPGNDDGHLSARYVGILLSRTLPPGWTGHKFRHRAGTRWYDVNQDLLVVQQLLGHASPTTTQVYVAVQPDSLRATVVAAAA